MNGIGRTVCRDWRVVLGLLVAMSLGSVADEVSPGSATALRSMKYTHRSAEGATAWQNQLRMELFKAMKMDRLLPGRESIAFAPEEVKSEEKDKYVLRDLTLQSTAGRRIKVVVTVPMGQQGPFPAVVCIHGHGGNRFSAYDPQAEPNAHIYKAYGSELARRGFVTIAPEVGQHEVYEPGRTLMGERLWDVMRCVDYLESLPEVDRSRIGCAGLSLGGEMAMWLGAMDPRIKATVSAGFLTNMDHMEQNHCMCWKFDGLRERADWADIYSLIAPRALQCQNGLKEPATEFTVELARPAMDEIRAIYQDLGRPDNAALLVHDGAHEIALDELLSFLTRHLGSEP